MNPEEQNKQLKRKLQHFYFMLSDYITDVDLEDKSYDHTLYEHGKNITKLIKRDFEEEFKEYL